VFELLLLLIVVAESRGFFAFEHSGIKEIEHLGIYRSQCKGRAAKDVAQVDELKEKEEISLHIFSFSSIHPFWPFSPFHAQNRLQLEESSGIDSRQHDWDCDSRIEGFSSSNFLISNFNLTCSHFNNARVRRFHFEESFAWGAESQMLKSENHKLVMWQWLEILNFFSQQLSSKERQLCLLLLLLLTDPGWRWDLRGRSKVDWMSFFNSIICSSTDTCRCRFDLELLNTRGCRPVGWMLNTKSFSCCKDQSHRETETVRWSPLTTCSLSHDQWVCFVSFILKTTQWQLFLHRCLFCLFWQSNVVNDFRFAFPSPSYDGSGASVRSAAMFTSPVGWIGDCGFFGLGPLCLSLSI